MPGSTWADLLGPRRRAERDQRMRKHCWVGVPDEEPWVSPEVDADALEMAYVLLALISPVSPPERDREAIQAFGAMSAVLDSAGTKMKGFTTKRDLLDRPYRGTPIKEWARRAARGVDEWTADLMLAGLYHQIEQLSENRVERDLADTRWRHQENQDYRKYLLWRDYEGWYYGGLLCCAIAGGIDLRDIPTQWIDETLEASILAFDIHGMLRHACEDELGHSLNYLPGGQHAQVAAALAAYTEILFRIQSAHDLPEREKLYLMRFISGIVLASYGTSRYNKTTAVHVAKPEDVTVRWNQLNDDPLYRYTYTEAR